MHFGVEHTAFRSLLRQHAKTWRLTMDLCENETGKRWGFMGGREHGNTWRDTNWKLSIAIGLYFRPIAAIVTFAKHNQILLAACSSNQLATYFPAPQLSCSRITESECSWEKSRDRFRSSGGGWATPVAPSGAEEWRGTAGFGCSERSMRPSESGVLRGEPGMRSKHSFSRMEGEGGIGRELDRRARAGESRTAGIRTSEEEAEEWERRRRAFSVRRWDRRRICKRTGLLRRKKNKVRVQKKEDNELVTWLVLRAPMGSKVRYVLQMDTTHCLLSLADAARLNKWDPKN